MLVTGTLFIFRQVPSLSTWTNASNVKAHHGAAKDNTCAVRFSACGEFVGTAIYGIDDHSTWCVWRITSQHIGMFLLRCFS